jgi:UDP-glucose 4-epimerase
MVLGVIGLTGANGMLGRHVRVALRHAGYEVRAIGRRPSSHEDLANWDLAQWKSDGELDLLFSGVQAVVHAGALVPGSEMSEDVVLYDVNVRACANLGQWALRRNVPVVFISGATVYADTLASDIREDAALGWGWGGYYGLTKLLAEDIWERLRMLGSSVAILRPSSIYGFGLPSNKVLCRFLKSACENSVISLSTPLEDKVDFVHAADVAHAVVAVLNRRAWTIFNIASGCPVSFRELAEACVDVSGAGRVDIVDGATDGVRSPITRYALNIDRAKANLGWYPAINIRKGLKMMIESSVANLSEFPSFSENIGA